MSQPLTYGAFGTWRRAIRRSHDRAVQFGNRAKRDYLRSAVAGELGVAPAATPPGLDPAGLADLARIIHTVEFRAPSFEHLASAGHT